VERRALHFSLLRKIESGLRPVDFAQGLMISSTLPGGDWRAAGGHAAGLRQFILVENSLTLDKAKCLPKSRGFLFPHSLVKL
jgi:hypothetical protein